MTVQLSYRNLLDALPIPVFVVDRDVRIVDLNQAAADFCRGTKGDLRLRRGGEVLHCLHANDVPRGCGQGPACNTCIIRNVVGDCLNGAEVRRRRFRMEVVHGEQRQQKELLLTASPVSDDHSGKLALLMVEDMTEVST